MRRSLQKGETDITGLVVLGILILIIVITPKEASPRESIPYWNSQTNLSSLTITSAPNQSQGENSGEIRGTQIVSSGYANSIAISSGNAPFSYQAYEEYITIENRGRSPINMTGWQLRNGKDRRTYYQGGALQRFSADIALIPQGTLLLSPSGNSLMQDVVLASGERAIVTTGLIAVNIPYKITSFKENICTGYIENLSDYSFSPPLNQNCPRPDLESGIINLPGECRDFIRDLRSCRTPEFNAKTPDGYPCSTCVNGKILSSQCFDFIKERYSYQGCVANHSSDPNFYGRTWRIFLGRGWEMWAKEYETIELYDRLGQLVGFQNY